MRASPSAKVPRLVGQAQQAHGLALESSAAQRAHCPGRRAPRAAGRPTGRWQSRCDRPPGRCDTPRLAGRGWASAARGPPRKAKPARVEELYLVVLCPFDAQRHVPGPRLRSGVCKCQRSRARSAQSRGASEWRWLPASSAASSIWCCSRPRSARCSASSACLRSSQFLVGRFVQPGVLDGHGDLVGQRLYDQHVIGVKGVGPGGSAHPARRRRCPPIWMGTLNSERVGNTSGYRLT